MADPLTSAFERMARDFLAGSPTLRYEWRDVKNRWWGNRRDLVFQPDSPDAAEVFASLNDGQITVGDGKSHDDFEDFGRGLSDEQVAREAFEKLVALLEQHGYISK